MNGATETGTAGAAPETEKTRRRPPKWRLGMPMAEPQDGPLPYADAADGDGRIDCEAAKHWRLRIDHHRGEIIEDGRPKPGRFTSAVVALVDPLMRTEALKPATANKTLFRASANEVIDERDFDRRKQAAAAVAKLAAKLTAMADRLESRRAKKAPSTPLGRLDAPKLRRIAGAVVHTWYNRHRAMAALRAPAARRRRAYLRKTLRSLYRKPGFQVDGEGRMVTRAEVTHAGARKLMREHGVPECVALAYQNSDEAEGAAVETGPHTVTFELRGDDPEFKHRERTWADEPASYWTRNVQIRVRLAHDSKIVYDKIHRRITEEFKPELLASG